MEPKIIQYQSSVIFVQDMAASRHFYETLLGQEVEMDFGPNVSYKGGFALWQVEHAFQILYERTPDNVKPLGRQNLELYFETTGIKTAAAHLEQAGVKFVHPLREQPWAQYVLRVYDPDGHIVELGEPMPAVVVRLLGEGLSAKKVAERTGMPLDIVKQIAAG